MAARRVTGYAVLALAPGLVLAPGMARAQQVPAPLMPVAFGADEVNLDARGKALEARGHVHVDQPPFHLTSDDLTLRRVPLGVELDGQGRLGFCPCLGTPLAVRFREAEIAPPHDVVLRSPVLEVLGVPVAWAPLFWLRSPGRVGLLAPDVEWRGGDGLLVGEGVHLPWTNGDLQRGLDLRAGGYVDGGVAVDADLKTATTETRLVWDHLHEDDGVGVHMSGATEGAAWDVDALRGARAVAATTDPEAAGRPFDRATGEAQWRSSGWSFAAGARTVALRGGDLLDLGAGGPVIAARNAGAMFHGGAYDVSLEGGSVGEATLGTTTFARAEGGALFSSALGPVGATLALRGAGDVADDGVASGADGGAEVRAALALPLVRAFSSADVGDPWVHETSPRVEVAGLAMHTGDVLVVPAGRGLVLPDGEALVADAGWSNAIARWGSRASAEIDASGGIVDDATGARPALRARAAASEGLVGMGAEVARVPSGGAFVGRLRLGPRSGLHVAANVAERDGVDPLVARALTDAPLEPSSGFLALSGWTGGARVAIPLGPRITTRAGADIDLDARELVAALGALELHDPCGCVVVRATAAHRIGREGVDVWLTVDLPH